MLGGLLAPDAQAELISRYSGQRVKPIVGKGATKGKVVGFKLRLVLHSESPSHDLAWVGLVKMPEELRLGKKDALYDKGSAYWLKSWDVAGVKQGEPKEVELRIFYKDNPALVPGSKVQIATTWPTESTRAEPKAWKHSFGADWGSGWGEPPIELPKVELGETK